MRTSADPIAMPVVRVWLAVLTLAIPTLAGAQTPLPLPFTPSPDPQHDVIAPHAGAADFQPSMDEMSWTTFIALNWPASDGHNGVANRNNTIGGRMADPEGGSGMPVGPTVWETFKNTNDIFLNPPTKPSGFNVSDIVPPECKLLGNAPSGRVKVLDMKSKTSQVIDGTSEAFSGPLYDQNSKNVWYEVRVNEEEYNFIVNNGYYDSAKQPATIAFPSGSNLTANTGPIHVKAAWKQLDPQKDDASRFYTSTAYTLDPVTKKCSLTKLGLVGLHMVHKTSTRPQWVWSTFEQIDNAPTQGVTYPAKQKWSFNNPACPNCPVNVLPKPGVIAPVQVVRIVPLPSDKVQLNQQYQAWLKSNDSGKWKNVWQYYQLIDTQWPAAPDQPSIFGGPTPTYLANTTLETYFQQPVADPTTPHSCMACHGTYAFQGQNTDFMFQLQKACPKASWCKATGGLARLSPGPTPGKPLAPTPAPAPAPKKKP